MNIDTLAKALTGTKNAIDIVSKISDIATKSAMLDLQENIANLRSGLIDVKESLMDAREQNLELKEENAGLKRELEKKEKSQIKEMIEESGFHYEGQGKNPICPNCYTNKSQIILLNDTAGMVFKCSACNYTLNTAANSGLRKRK
jgi:regulator of replication initiation timing